jgi:hypothetical protein
MAPSPTIMSNKLPLHQVYRGMYINIINTITYDKGNLLDIIVGEGVFHQVYRGMYINNNEHYNLR